VTRTPPHPLYRPQSARLLVERTVLDEQVRGPGRDPQPWGAGTWLGPLLVLALVLVLGPVVDILAPDDGVPGTVVAVATLLGSELLLLAALFGFGRTVARRGGGWRRTFGLDVVRGQDWLPWLIGAGMVFVGRVTVGVTAEVVGGGRALEESANLHVGPPTLLGVVVLGLAVAVLAPITEELMFRGLLLRSFLRRMSFWPAALLSTLLFAVFHMPAVDTALGAVTLAASVAVVGLGNCFLVRITGRLAPAMMLHASFNALSLTVAFAMAA